MTAILSGDFKAGEKLPSVREIALRFKIHQNTVSTAYRWLEENGWAESRQGSGVFVCELAKETRENAAFKSQNELDELISKFFQNAHRRGFTNAQIEARFQKFLANPKPERILIVENDEYLRRIIFTELLAAINFPVIEISPDRITTSDFLSNSVIAALPETAVELKRLLPEASIFSLKINSAQIEIRGQEKPDKEDLIGIVSGWEMFLRWARTFLIAIGIDTESIITRDAREKNFQKGLDSCAFVITDSATAQILPKGLNRRVFKLISDASISELKNFISL